MNLAQVERTIPLKTGDPVLVKRLDELSQPIVLAALGFWESYASEGMPDVSHIDPIQLRTFLNNIVLIDVIWPDGQQTGIGSPVDFSYRLIGQDSADIHDVNLTGKRVSELTQFGPRYSDVMMTFYTTVCRRKVPVAAGGSLDIIGKGFRDFEGVYMPFTRCGDRVDRIMAVIAYL